jgi:hypothetical protein
MRANKNHHSVGRDSERDFAADREATDCAREWAGKCVIHREAGRNFEAKRAEQKARFWSRKALEGQATQANAQGDRIKHQ